MDNQSSPVQILSPTIPNSWCPSGDWSDIFNSYNQLYLNNSTINIPGLNQVTPQQIQTLQQSVLSIQNQLDAVSYQSGSITSITIGVGTYIVVFPTAMPNSNYSINIYFNATATPSEFPTWSVSSDTITTTGFTFFANCTTNAKVSSIVWSVSNLSAL